MTIRPNKRRFGFGVFLLTGHTPWGVKLPWGDGQPRMTLHGAEWIMCCGQVMRQAEVEQWKAAGLVIDGPHGPNGHPTIIAGPNLDHWVSSAWHDMRARSWVK